MSAESFETIMARNNTTLPAAQTDGGKNVKRGSKRCGLSVAVFAVYVCFCLVYTVGAASTHVPQKREIASPAEPTITGMPLKMCSPNSPCGWAIYVPFSRRIDYFMKNTCECKNTQSCLKSDDDLSINAYVYRCKPKPAVTTTDVMPSDA
ncbi:Hypothetical protein CINCED_3A020351 [Cinara cedri]|uniref:Uncharacterized protein n=1 Tax=Cinara cedri TaxID=506608 RepID=A0A5E4MEA9_9HEMI|nr:Hypothetical protein CINCED_3A020351 [Cinara cedri]